MKKKKSKKLILLSIAGISAGLLTIAITSTAFVFPNRENFQDKTRRLTLNYSGSIYDKTRSVKFVNRNWNSQVLTAHKFIDELDERIDFSTNKIRFNVIKSTYHKINDLSRHNFLVGSKKSKFTYEYNSEINSLKKLQGVINFQNQNKKIMVVSEGVINDVNLNNSHSFGIIFPSEFPILYGNDHPEQVGFGFKFPIPNKITGVQTIGTWSSYGMFKTSSYNNQDYYKEMTDNLENHFLKSVDKIIYIKNSKNPDSKKLDIAKKFLKTNSSSNIDIVDSDFIAKINNIYSVQKTIANVFKNLEIINQEEYESLEFKYNPLYDEKYGLNRNGTILIKNEQNEILNIWATSKEIYNLLTSMGYFVKYFSYNNYLSDYKISEEEKETFRNWSSVKLITDKNDLMSTFVGSDFDNNFIGIIVTPEWNLYTNKRIKGFIAEKNKLDTSWTKRELHTFKVKSRTYTDFPEALMEKYSAWNAHIN